jgi:hypothetical protein
MGNKQSYKNREQCFAEIRFVIKTFCIKYESIDCIPKYGCKRILEDLEEDEERNWKKISFFLEQSLKYMRFDTNVLMTVNQIEDKQRVINSYSNDITNLQEKIREISKRYGYEKKLK